MLSLSAITCAPSCAAQASGSPNQQQQQCGRLRQHWKHRARGNTSLLQGFIHVSRELIKKLYGRSSCTSVGLDLTGASCMPAVRAGAHHRGRMARGPVDLLSTSPSCPEPRPFLPVESVWTFWSLAGIPQHSTALHSWKGADRPCHSKPAPTCMSPAHANRTLPQPVCIACRLSCGASQASSTWPPLLREPCWAGATRLSRS